MSLAGSLPAYERHLIEANHYRITGESDKATAAYEALLKASPSSAVVLFDLGELYEEMFELDKAEQHYTQVVALDPKFVEGLLGLGRVKIRRGNEQGALEHLNAARTLAITLNREEAHANILQAIGVAYRRLGQLDEALKNYEASLAIKRTLKDTRGMARSHTEIAQVHEAFGRANEAEQSYREALRLQREIGDHNGRSISLVNLAGLINERFGRSDEALTLLKEALQIRRDAGNPNAEAIVLNNIGNVYLAKGDYVEAQTYFERTLSIREKTGVPELADTLHNLGETLARLGKFDEALKHYVRALGLRRDAGDARTAAIESYGIGTILDYQGSYGRAVSAKEEALTTFRKLEQRDVWLAEILAGYGHSLSLAGRHADAATALDEALRVAETLKSDVHIVQATRFQAERLGRTGDWTAAKPLADRAAQLAASIQDRGQALAARATAAMTAAALTPTTAIAATLGAISSEAGKVGLRQLEVEAAVAQAEALLRAGNAPAARTRADRALSLADVRGLRVLQAKAHFLLAEAQRASGTAAQEYRAVIRILDLLRAEEGNQQILDRADLRTIYDASQKR
jgi:tetratricopeptide (TPR) repeat protein